jgi:protein-S-isoprenylcysteine O-methyltransferase Ste14
VDPVGNKDRLYEFISKHRRMLNALLGCIGILVMVTENRHWLQQFGGGEALAVVGWILVVAGAGVRHWAALYLGGHKNRQLITKGPYELVRNPLYAGNLIAATGLVLLSESAVAGLFVLTGLTLIFLATIGYEERKLLRNFGEDYQNYKDQVPMLIPHWNNIRQMLDSQDGHQISYRNIRREIVRGLWLIVAAVGLLASVAIIKHLQATYPFLVLIF